MQDLTTKSGSSAPSGGALVDLGEAGVRSWRGLTGSTRKYSVGGVSFRGVSPKTPPRNYRGLESVFPG